MPMMIMLIQRMILMANDANSDGKAAEIKSLTERTDRLNHAVDFWNEWMIAGLILAAVAAVLIVLATRMIVLRTQELTDAQGQLADTKEAQLTLDLKEKDRQIAVAGSESAHALEQAKSAEAHLADANAKLLKQMHEPQHWELKRLNCENNW